MERKDVHLLLLIACGRVGRVALAHVGSAGILYVRPSFAKRPIRAKLVRPRVFLRKARVLDSNRLRSCRAGESAPHMRIQLRIPKIASSIPPGLALLNLARTPYEQKEGYAAAILRMGSE